MDNISNRCNIAKIVKWHVQWDKQCSAMSHEKRGSGSDHSVSRVGGWVSEWVAPRNRHNKTFNPNIGVNRYTNNDKIDL
jgi:hypothetical protein